MAGDTANDSLLELFLYETEQNLEQLEKIILESEQAGSYSPQAVNEIFRMMHTIKGSAAMMMFQNIAALAHHLEDMFSFIREKGDIGEEYGNIADLVLEGVDFIKSELTKIKTDTYEDESSDELNARIGAELSALGAGPAVKKAEPKRKTGKAPLEETAAPAAENRRKDALRAHVFFQEGCMMESIRAFNIISNMKEFADVIAYSPADIAENDNGTEEIRKNGFTVDFITEKSAEQARELLEETLFVREARVSSAEEAKRREAQPAKERGKAGALPDGAGRQPKAAAAPAENAAASIISVSVSKLDKLMDLVSELVIAQEMLIHSPDLAGLPLENFNKAAGQLKKITGELRESTMSVRMVPLTVTFQKTNRIVRDMSKKLGKKVRVEVIGEDIEVDKNIIEHISDPLMHLIRNALDHGIESPEERAAAGKPEEGTVVLEARNEGAEILIIVSDDGRGLNRDKLIASAAKKEIKTKPPSEMTDKEVYSLIFMPGFSTKEQVSEFSGRGVGMDVVVNNIESIGGRITVDSEEGAGSEMVMRFPTTLSIIEGMNILVGSSLYTLAVNNIGGSFKPQKSDLLKTPEGREMVMARGECYQVVRLYEAFGVEPRFTEPEDGVFIIVEALDKKVCLLVDELVGQQEVVVKSVPKYLKKIKGVAGCTLLGNGDISLIIDPIGIMQF